MLFCRAKALDGFLDRPNKTKIKIRKQEFLYNINIWANII